MENTKATIFAGYCARTNMGQSRDKERLARAKFAHNLEHWNLNTSVEHFCQEFIEGDDGYDIFMEEAQGWLAEFLKMSNEQFAQKWPYMEAEWKAVDPKRFKQALAIDEGASNMIPIARVLHESAQECLIESIAPQRDPAIRLIVHQMAHLCDVGSTMSLTDYNHVVEACKKEAAKYAGQ